MTLFSKTLFVGALIFASQLFADVDIKSGSFSISRADQGLSSEFSGFKINRTYSSTVGYEGLFGYGWCSSLETVLAVTAQGQLALIECGAGEVRLYNSADFKNENITLAVEKLRQQMQSVGKDMSPVERDEYVKSRTRRAQLAAQYKPQIEVSKKTYLLNPFPNEDEVAFNGNQFIRKTASGLVQQFDLQGRLISQKHKTGDVIKITYDKNGIKSIQSQRDQNITFKLNENGQVIEMRGPQGVTKYSYSAEAHLLTVSQKIGEEKYTYQDDLMISAEGVENTKISYNPVTRFVSKLSKNDCIYNYKYNIEKSSLKFKVDYESKCKDQASEKISYDFQYKQDEQGMLFQKRMTASDGKGKLTSAEYIGEGMPSKIIRNNLEFKFGYDEQKRVISKETAERKIDYIYSDGGRLVSARITPKKVKSATAETHQFNYDKENRLASVNLKNDTIRYSYDKKGRLTKIQTKAGPNFSILNDGLTGQVKRITALGIGHFDIQYKNGKILKSKWKGDLNKALAVIDTYELLRGPYEQSMEFGVPK